MSRRGNIGSIIRLILCLIQYYWVWELCPIWVKTPLQCVALYYMAVWYFYFISSFYKDVMYGDIDEYDGTLLFLSGLAALGVPILFYFVYLNTLNKIFLTIQDIIGGYHSYFIENAHTN